MLRYDVIQTGKGRRLWKKGSVFSRNAGWRKTECSDEVRSHSHSSIQIRNSSILLLWLLQSPQTLPSVLSLQDLFVQCCKLNVSLYQYCHNVKVLLPNVYIFEICVLQESNKLYELLDFLVGNIISCGYSLYF